VGFGQHLGFEVGFGDLDAGLRAGGAAGVAGLGGALFEGGEIDGAGHCGHDGGTRATHDLKSVMPSSAASRPVEPNATGGMTNVTPAVSAVSCPAASNDSGSTRTQNQGITLTACAAQPRNAVPGAAPGEFQGDMQRDPGT